MWRLGDRWLGENQKHPPGPPMTLGKLPCKYGGSKR